MILSPEEIEKIRTDTLNAVARTERQRYDALIQAGVQAILSKLSAPETDVVELVAKSLIDDITFIGNDRDAGIVAKNLLSQIQPIIALAAEKKERSKFDTELVDILNCIDGGGDYITAIQNLRLMLSGKE